MIGTYVSNVIEVGSVRQGGRHLLFAVKILLLHTAPPKARFFALGKQFSANVLMGEYGQEKSRLYIYEINTEMLGRFRFK